MDDRDPDWYRLLDIPADASADAIHVAYRREAKLWHPDRNHAEGAAERFKLINAAHHALTDPDRRRAYDRARVPRLVFEPDVIEFGVLGPNDPPRDVVVDLLNVGYPYAPETVIDFEEPQDGPFWRVFAVGFDEETEDSRILRRYAFEVDGGGGHVAPGAHEHRVSARLVCDSAVHPGELTLRMTVRGRTEATRSRSAATPSRSAASARRKPRLGPRSLAVLILGIPFGIPVVFLVSHMIAALFGHGHGHPVATGPEISPRASVVPADVPAAGSTIRLPGKVDVTGWMVLDNGQLLAPNDSGDVTLLNPDGTLKWHVHPANDGPRVSTAVTPHCVALAYQDGGADLISLDTGAQTPVPPLTMPTASGPTDTHISHQLAASGDNVAWADGKIRNACTGAVVDTAVPVEAFGEPQCLVNSTLITNTTVGRTAWRHGTRLWTSPIDSELLCDPQGTVLGADPETGEVSLIDPRTGGATWWISDPLCPSAQDQGCIVRDDPLVRLDEAGDVLFLHADDGVVALAKDTGRVLWIDRYDCFLGSRSAPTAEALVGPCGAQATNPTVASIIDPRTGDTIRDITALGTPPPVGGAAETTRWLANARQLDVLELGTDTSPTTARVTNW